MYQFSGRSLVLFITCFLYSLVIFGQENMPAGSGTTQDFSVQAFSHPLSGTRGQLRRSFVVGNSFFKSAWVMAPSSTPLRDGLGPLYNATSCTSCHVLDGRGRGLPDQEGATDISLLFRLREIGQDQKIKLHSLYGGQFQPFGIDGTKGEGSVTVSYTTIKGRYADGEEYELQKPIYKFSHLNHGELSKQSIVSPRVGSQLLGLGLLENIKEEDILKNVDLNDENKDGISGKANYPTSLIDGKKRLGRFGWKAGKSSLLEQNAAAFNHDIGLTNELITEEECTKVQIDCLHLMSSSDISSQILTRVTEYTKLLAVPSVRNFNSEQYKKGKVLFKKLNCTGCHTPSFTTSDHSKISVLNNQEIYPYTDLLLHDMGEGLSDDLRVVQNEDLALTSEWKTPPLWGLGLIGVVNGHNRLLHDGRARGFAEAILWHGGEAQKSKNMFLNLSKKERNDLIEFLRSI